MCEDKSPLRRFLSSLGIGGAAGVAKASPGIVVSGLSFYGIPVEHWISILTVIYLCFMLMGAIPKAIDGIRYALSLLKPSKAIFRIRNQLENADLRRKLKQRGVSHEKTTHRHPHA